MNILKGSPKTMSVGGFTFDWDPKNNPNDLMLAAAANDGTTKSNHTPRLLNGSSGYQVPAGKTLLVVALKTFNWAASNASVGLSYGDTDIGQASTAGPTNPVDLAAGGYFFQIASGVGNTGEIGGLLATIPAGKYLNLVTGGSTTERATTALYCKLI